MLKLSSHLVLTFTVSESSNQTWPAKSNTIVLSQHCLPDFLLCRISFFPDQCKTDSKSSIYVKLKAAASCVILVFFSFHRKRQQLNQQKQKVTAVTLTDVNNWWCKSWFSLILTVHMHKHIHTYTMWVPFAWSWVLSHAKVALVGSI